MVRLNPNIEAEGITRMGTQGLRRLKSNNMDRDILKAGLDLLIWNKDVTVDLAAIIIGNCIDLIEEEIQSHRDARRWGEAQRWVDRRASITTTLNRPRQSIWEAIPWLRDTMLQREVSKELGKRRKSACK